MTDTATARRKSFSPLGLSGRTIELTLKALAQQRRQLGYRRLERKTYPVMLPVSTSIVPMPAVPPHLVLTSPSIRCGWLFP
jgi:hypothetical protein